MRLGHDDRPDRRRRPRDVSDRGEDDVNPTSCVAVYGPRPIAAVSPGSGPAVTTGRRISGVSGRPGTLSPPAAMRVRALPAHRPVGHRGGPHGRTGRQWAVPVSPSRAGLPRYSETTPVFLRPPSGKRRGVFRPRRDAAVFRPGSGSVWTGKGGPHMPKTVTRVPDVLFNPSLCPAGARNAGAKTWRRVMARTRASVSRRPPRRPRSTAVVASIVPGPGADQRTLSQIPRPGETPGNTRNPGRGASNGIPWGRRGRTRSGKARLCDSGTCQPAFRGARRGYRSPRLPVPKSRTLPQRDPGPGWSQGNDQATAGRTRVDPLSSRRLTRAFTSARHPAGSGKGGGGYLRTRPIHGAGAGPARAAGKTGTRGQWIDRPRERRHPDVVAGAPANRTRPPRATGRREYRPDHPSPADEGQSGPSHRRRPARPWHPPPGEAEGTRPPLLHPEGGSARVGANAPEGTGGGNFGSTAPAPGHHERRRSMAYGNTRKPDMHQPVPAPGPEPDRPRQQHGPDDHGRARCRRAKDLQPADPSRKHPLTPKARETQTGPLQRACSIDSGKKEVTPDTPA